MTRLLCVALLALAGCAQLLGLEDPTAASVDGGGASPDAGPVGGATPRQEVAATGGTVRGGGYQLSLQVGHPVAQTTAAGDGYAISSAAAVAP